MIIAHRGFAGQFPENTVGAVRAASGVGPRGVPDAWAADVIEIDAVPTADGTVVAFHDSELSGRDGGESSGGTATYGRPGGGPRPKSSSSSCSTSRPSSSR